MTNKYSSFAINNDSFVNNRIYDEIISSENISEIKNDEYRTSYVFTENLFSTENSLEWESISDPVKKQLEKFKDSFYSVIKNRKYLLDKSGLLPNISFSDPKDGSVIAEWGSPDMRLGFVFESDIKESSWYFVSNKKFEQKMYTSKISENDLLNQIDFGLSLIASNT